MRNLLEKFRNYEEKLNKSDKTIKVYVKEVNYFLDKYNLNSIESLKIMEEKEKYKNGIIYKNILKKLKKGDHISISFDRQNMKCYGEEFIIKEIVYIHLYK